VDLKLGLQQPGRSGFKGAGGGGGNGGGANSLGDERQRLSDLMRDRNAMHVEVPLLMKLALSWFAAPLGSGSGSHHVLEPHRLPPIMCSFSGWQH